MDTIAMKYCFGVSFTTNRERLLFEVTMPKIPANKPTVAEIKNVVSHALKKRHIEDSIRKIVCVEEIDGKTRDRIVIKIGQEHLAAWTLLQ